MTDDMRSSSISVRVSIKDEFKDAVEAYYGRTFGFIGYECEQALLLHAKTLRKAAAAQSAIVNGRPSVAQMRENIAKKEAKD